VGRERRTEDAECYPIPLSLEGGGEQIKKRCLPMVLKGDTIGEGKKNRKVGRGGRVGYSFSEGAE